MREPYGVAGRRRFFTTLLAQGATFTALFASTFLPETPLFTSLEPAGALVLALAVAALSAWIWLLTHTLLSWSIRVEMPLAPLVHRYVFTPLLVGLAGVAMAATLLAAFGPAPAASSATALLALRVLAGATALFSLAMGGLALHLWWVMRKDMARLRAMFAAFKDRHHGADLRRLERYVEQETSTYENPGSIVRGSSFPALGARPVHDRAQFGWTRMLEEAFETIRDEALAVYQAGGEYKHYLYPGVGDAKWRSLIFIDDGRRNEANCARCPETARILSALPVTLAREAMFSLVMPGAVLKPHRDAHNMILTCHMALTVPPECQLRIAGETHTWQEGKCLIIDTSYEHEVWNRSDQPRIVLLVDFLHPELTPVEQKFVEEIANSIL